MKPIKTLSGKIIGYSLSPQFEKLNQLGLLTQIQSLSGKQLGFLLPELSKLQEKVDQLKAHMPDELINELNNIQQMLKVYNILESSILNDIPENIAIENINDALQESENTLADTSIENDLEADTITQLIQQLQALMYWALVNGKKKIFAWALSCLWFLLGTALSPVIENVIHPEKQQQEEQKMQILKEILKKQDEINLKFEKQNDKEKPLQEEVKAKNDFNHLI